MQNMENIKTTKLAIYGIEAFLENNMLFFHTFQKPMFYKRNSMSCQK
jgi:hypothetical protein